LYTLITTATTAQAQKLKNRLGAVSVIMGDYRELPGVMLKTSTLVKLPDPASPSYAHQMLTLCLDRQIDVVYTLSEQEYQQLTAAGVLFSEYGIEIIAPAAC
jgi:hypothetical protein